MPLQSILVEEPFAQWGLDVIVQSTQNIVKDIHIFSLQLTILQNGKKLWP
jgi:hypothetical protein